MKQVPVKIEYEKKWHSIKLGISENAFSFPEPISKEIKFKEIDDVEEKKNMLIMGTKSGNSYKIASIPKVLQIIKRTVIMGCTAYRLVAYFMSPAIRGGVLINSAKWDKGAIAVLKTSIWFVGRDKQISIPLDEVSGIDITKRDVQGKDSDVIHIDHIENDEVVTSFILCPLTTLEILYNYLKDATKDLDVSAGELDSVSGQVAMLVYSGMDSHAIEKMVNITHKQLESVYDKLIEKQIVDVVLTRREVKLTTKGVRFVNESVKP